MANGDILSAVILGADPHNGWVAEIEIEGWSGQIGSVVYDFGYDADSLPTVATPNLTVVSEGYDSAGVLGTISRDMYLTERVRKPYPNDAQADEAVSGSNLKVRVALSDYIYDDDKNGGAGTSGTDPVIDIPAGVFNNGLVDSNAVTGLAITNNSTLDYPKAFGRWAWPGYQQVTADFRVEFSAHSRFGANFKPVAAVKFTSIDDSLNTGADQFATDENISTYSTRGNPVPVYTADIPVVALTQGETIEVNAVVYPHVGDENSIFNTALIADGDADSAKPGPQYYLNDKSGTWGNSWAVVDTVGGNDGSAAVSGVSEAVAAATPYLTHNTAIAALKAYNLANYGRDTCDGSILALTDAGSHNFPPTNVTMSNTEVWMIVKARDGAGPVTISQTVGNKLLRGWIKIEGIAITSGQVGAFRGLEATGKLWFDDLPGLTLSTGTAPIYQWDEFVITRSQIDRIKTLDIFSSNRSPNTILRGNDLKSTVDQTELVVYYVAGNIGKAKAGDPNTGGAGAVANDMSIMSHNTLMSDATRTYSNGSYAKAIGAAIVGNILENINNTAQPDLVVHADSNILASEQIILAGNTIVGERTNWLYNDISTTNTARRNQRAVGNSHQSFNTKTDTFNHPTDGPSGLRVGNWGPFWRVGVSHYHTYQTLSADFDGEFDGLGRSNGLYLFTDDATDTGTNLGGGDYTPASGSPLKARVPANDQYSRFDVIGSQRADGGDVGAIETVAPDYSLAINSMALAMMADQVAISKEAPLALDAMTSTMVVDPVPFTAVSPLAVNDAALAVQMEQISVSGLGPLTLDDMGITPMIDAMAVSGVGALTINDLTISTMVDAMSFVGLGPLDLDSMAVNVSVDVISLAKAGALILNDLALAIEVGQINTLGAGDLAIDSLAVSVLMDPLVIAAIKFLDIDGLALGVSIEGLTLAKSAALMLDNIKATATVEQLTVIGSAALSLQDMQLSPSITTMILVSGILKIPTNPSVQWMDDPRVVTIMDDLKSIQFGE